MDYDLVMKEVHQRQREADVTRLVADVAYEHGEVAGIRRVVALLKEKRAEADAGKNSVFDTPAVYELLGLLDDIIEEMTDETPTPKIKTEATHDLITRLTVLPNGHLRCAGIKGEHMDFMLDEYISKQLMIHGNKTASNRAVVLIDRIKNCVLEYPQVVHMLEKEAINETDDM